MSETAVPTPRIDLFRYRLEGGVEHYVAHSHGEERIVATLRLEPVRTAPLRTLARIGASVLPDADGAYVSMTADSDPTGLAGLALATAAALASRRQACDDAFWLAACPPALEPAALELGWRALPSARDEPAARGAPVVLLVDDVGHFEAIGSPLAAIPSRGSPPPIAPQTLLDALELPPSEEPGARLRAGH
jgi:hypothetical protein